MRAQLSSNQLAASMACSLPVSTAIADQRIRWSARRATTRAAASITAFRVIGFEPVIGPPWKFASNARAKAKSAIWRYGERLIAPEWSEVGASAPAAAPRGCRARRRHIFRDEFDAHETKAALHLRR